MPITTHCLFLVVAIIGCCLSHALGCYTPWDNPCNVDPPTNTCFKIVHQLKAHDGSLLGSYEDGTADTATSVLDSNCVCTILDQNGEAVADQRFITRCGGGTVIQATGLFYWWDGMTVETGNGPDGSSVFCEAYDTSEGVAGALLATPGLTSNSTYFVIVDPKPLPVDVDMPASVVWNTTNLCLGFSFDGGQNNVTAPAPSELINCIVDRTSYVSHIPEIAGEWTSGSHLLPLQYRSETLYDPITGYSINGRGTFEVGTVCASDLSSYFSGIEWVAPMAVADGQGLGGGIQDTLQQVDVPSNSIAYVSSSLGSLGGGRNDHKSRAADERIRGWGAWIGLAVFLGLLPWL